MHDTLQISAPSVPEAVPDSLVQHPAIPHLTFEAPDSVLGAYFVGSPAPLTIHRHTADPGHQQFPLPKDTVFLDQFKALWSPVVTERLEGHPEVAWHPVGIAGSPTEYQFRHDDFVTAYLLISFLMMAWVVTSSWKFFKTQFRDFFHTRERPNLFGEHEDTVLRGRLFLVIQTCVMIALVFFTLSRSYLPDVFAQVSPYLLLGTSTLVALGYYGVKMALYNIVNHTFFSANHCRMWNEVYLTSVLVTGLSLLPVALSIVFLDLPLYYILIACILLLSVIKISLAYKCHHIFFKTTLGGVHLILYLCTLEFIPLILFAVLLIATSQSLM